MRESDSAFITVKAQLSNLTYVVWVRVVRGQVFALFIRIKNDSVWLVEILI